MDWYSICYLWLTISAVIAVGSVYWLIDSRFNKLANDVYTNKTAKQLLLFCWAWPIILLVFTVYAAISLVKEVVSTKDYK